MSEISKLLNDAQSTYRTQLNETKKYVAKWEKTGLLEGIDHDYELVLKSGMALLYHL